MTRGCYGKEGKRRARSPTSPVYRPTSLTYSKVFPVYSNWKVVAPAETADDEETQLPGGTKAIETKAIDVDQESQDPYGCETPSYNPVSKDFVLQNPAGSPVYHVNSPTGYCRITGEPIYGPKKATGHVPTWLGYSATSPTYTPMTPASPPPIPTSPHVLAANKRACLRWGA
jgi:hypothetical protein